MGKSQVPEELNLETLFSTQVKKHFGLKGRLPYYGRLPVDPPENTTTFLLTTVRRYLKAERRCKASNELSNGGPRALPAPEGARRELRVVIIHRSIKASVLEATTALACMAQSPKASRRAAIAAHRTTATRLIKIGEHVSST